MNMNLFFSTDPTEKPLEHPVTDGGYCGILRTIACVGDSLSSGEMETVDAAGERHFLDLYDFSWGQYLARMTGTKVYNFSRGGMSAKWYCDSFGDEAGCWDPDKASTAYIVALGVNDAGLIERGELEFGCVDDICLEDWRQNKPTFAGYYARILQRYREISPKARLFLMTPVRDEGLGEARSQIYQRMRELFCRLSEMLEFTYVIDLWQYGPVYGGEATRPLFLNGHLNAAGYLFTARMVASYVDYIIRHNMEDFTQIALVGTDMPPDVNYRW